MASNKNNPWIHPANKGAMSIIEYMSAEDTYESLKYLSSRPGGPMRPPVPRTPLQTKEDRFSALCRTISMWKRAHKMHGPYEIRDKWSAKYHDELDTLGADLVAMGAGKHTPVSIEAWRKRSNACRN